VTRGALQIIDELLAAGQCMHGGMTDSPCERLATSRDGYWATCDLHSNSASASNEDSDERKLARKISSRNAARIRWQKRKAPQATEEVITVAKKKKGKGY